VNDAPEAVDDTANTVEDTSVEIDVVANDTDPDTSDVITVTSVGDASNGMVSIDDDTGNILYTPDANFNGEDSFDYTISDGNGGTSTARVTVNVGGTNDDPTVGDSVSARATEDDASLCMTAWVTVNPRLSITPTRSKTANQVLSRRPPRSPSPVVNDNPDAQDDERVTDEDVSVEIDVLANDDDPDINDQGNLSVSVNDFPANGTADASGGVITYTPNPDFFGTNSFSYTLGGCRSVARQRRQQWHHAKR